MTMDVPTPGIRAVKTATLPQSTGLGMPKIKKPAAINVPWIIAINSLPLITELTAISSLDKIKLSSLSSNGLILTSNLFSLYPSLNKKYCAK